MKNAGSYFNHFYLHLYNRNIADFLPLNISKSMKHMLIKDYADKKKISERTVYNRIKTGELKTKKLGSITLIKLEE